LRLDHSCIRISRGAKPLSAKTLSSSFKYSLYLATSGSFPFLFFLLCLQGPREGYTTSRTCVVFSRGESMFLKFRGFSSSPLLFVGLGFAAFPCLCPARKFRLPPVTTVSIPLPITFAVRSHLLGLVVFVRSKRYFPCMPFA